MSRQRGHVFRHGGGWGYSFSYTHNGERRQVRRSSRYWQRRDAQRELTAALADVDGGRLMGAKRQTVTQYLESWLAQYARGGSVKPSTVDTARVVVQRYLVPGLGRVLLRDVTVAVLDSYLTQLLTGGRLRSDKHGGGLSPKTVRNVHGVLHRALADAVRWGLLPHNPASRVQLPRYERPAIRTWSAEQVARFVAHVDAHGDVDAALWRLLLVTGLRRGELLGLRWSDVDLVAGTVRVAQTRVMLRDGSHVTTTPKTRAGSRTVTVDAGTVTALAQLKNLHDDLAAQVGGLAHELVAVEPDGNPAVGERLLRRFRAAARAAGVPELRLHDGRHTAVTRQLEAGAPLHVVSHRVGHSQTSTTLNIYAHVLPDADRLAADVFGAQLDAAVAQLKRREQTRSV